MNIGIIIDKQNPNTKYIAEKLHKNFEKDGNTVTIEELEFIKTEDNEPKSNKLVNYPSIDDYDTIFVGAPLIKGELSPVMVEYLLELPHTEGKLSSGYITQFSLSSSKKGLVARDKMIELLVTKNIKVQYVENIKWLNPFLGRDI